MIGYNTARAYLEAKMMVDERPESEPDPALAARLLGDLAYKRMALLDEMLAQVATDVITGRGYHGRVMVAKG